VRLGHCSCSPLYRCCVACSITCRTRPVSEADAWAAVRAAQVQRFALRTRGDEAALPILSTTVRSSMASLDDDNRQPQAAS
jgi:hypothetical protein